MGINFDSLIREFKRHLLQLGDEQDRQKIKNESNASIFINYGDDFKDFVQEKYGADFDVANLSIKNLKKLQVSDGKFVLDEEKELEDMTDNDFAIGVINELLSDEEFSEFLDENSNGKLSKSEILNFAKFIADLDEKEDVNAISFDEILSGADVVMSGKYNTDEELSTPIQQSGGGGGYQGSRTGGTQNSTNQTNAEKKIDENSSASELEEARNKQATVVENNYADLKSAEGEYQESLKAQLQVFNEALEASEELNTEEKEMIAEYSNKINDKQIQISENRARVADIESQISGIESSISVTTSAVESCKAALASIPEPAEGEEDAYAGKKETLTAQIAQYEQQLQTLKEQLAQKNTQRDKENENLAKSQTELGQIQSEESEQRTLYEGFIEQLNQKTDSEFYKASQAVVASEQKITQNQTKIQTSEAELAKIEGYLKNRIKADAERLASSPDSKVFSDKPITYENKNMSGNTQMPYGVLIPEGADPNEPMPVLVFLHGLGASLDSAGNIINADLTQKGLNGFNGYVIYPTTSNGWRGDAKKLDEVLNDFASQYSIDPDNIVLTGHSLGGNGVIDMVQSSTFNDGEGYEFKKAAVLTGYIGLNSAIDTPMAVYADGGSHSALQDVKDNLELGEGGKDLWLDWRGVTHGKVDDEAFGQDSDGDGRSDLIEWLFDSYD